VLFEATVDGRRLRVEVRSDGARYTVTVDGRPLEVDHVETADRFSSLIVDGHSHDVGLERRPGGYAVLVNGEAKAVDLAEAVRGASLPAQRPPGPTALAAPMPGRVVRVLVEPGQEVAVGEGLVVVEAMKMENELRAPRAGRVREVVAREGEAVEAGAPLVVVD
jgi:biotin carboxyl carrier protein